MSREIRNFRKYGENHGLIVVDMQGYYLEESAPELADKIPVLIRRISLHINSCLIHGGKVIFIETDGAGDTQDIIRGQVNQRIQYHTLRKTRDSVISEGCPHKKTNEKTLKSHCMPPSFSITGINTLACVRKTSNSLVEIGLDVSLIPGATINTDCIDHNLLECLGHYRWGRGVLRDFKIGKSRENSLLDYL